MSTSCDSYAISAPRAPKMRAWWQSVRWECAQSRIFAALSVQNAGVALIWPLGMVTVTHFCDVERSECERGAHPGNGRGNSYTNSRCRAPRMRALRPSSFRWEARSSCRLRHQSAHSQIEQLRVCKSKLRPWLSVRCCIYTCFHV